jgi:hypothetical protein
MRRWMSMVFAIVAIGAAASGQTFPSTQPVTDVPADAPVRRWFSDLASPDAQQREQAQTELLGLNRQQLQQLRWLVAHGQAVAPSQLAALHEIVIHDFLSGEPYTPMDAGFLGLRWPDRGDVARLGVPVEIRIPGFPSFQMLRTGDLILGVITNPGTPIAQLPKLTPSRSVLTQVIQIAGANRDVVLEILRHGQRIRIALRLDPRPAETETEQAAIAFFNARQNKAEQYWQTEFLPLLRTNVS